MKNKSFGGILIGILFTISLVSVFVTRDIKDEVLLLRKVVASSNHVSFRLTELKSMISPFLPSDSLREQWKLIFVFSPDDCIECLDEINYWQELLSDYQGIHVMGIVFQRGDELAGKFVSQSGWTFPVHVIQEDSPHDYLGPVKTPIKILIEPNNSLYFVEGRKVNWREYGLLSQAISELNSGRRLSYKRFP